MSRPYTISEARKREYAGIYLFEFMVNKPATFALLLDEGDAFLETILEWLLIKGYVEIRDNQKYVPAEKGRETLKNFLSRYSEYLTVFDVFCAVDLESGEFAFASYFEYEAPSAFSNYLEDERWEDLRIAVAEYKKLDPVEIVFMSFIAEKRFGRDETGWQFDLLLGSVWDEILEICNSALEWEELGYEDEEEDVSGEQVIEDVIKQGAELMVELHKKEAELAPPIEHYEDNGEDDDEEEEYVVERVVIEEHPIDYYYPYYDPFYVSPLLLAVWLL